MKLKSTGRMQVSMFLNRCINFIGLCLLLFAMMLFGGCVDEGLREKAFEESKNAINNLDKDDAYRFFSKESFSKEEVESVAQQLRYCDYQNRKGKFVDYHYERVLGSKSDKVSFIYEYFLKCDSLRFILTYELKEDPELVWFGVEAIENKNPMITDSTKSLLQ